MRALTLEQEAVGIAAMRTRMLEGPFTFADLWPLANRAMGTIVAPDGGPGEGYRLADRYLQTCRKKGWISLGAKRVWSTTEAGRKALAQEAA